MESGRIQRNPDVPDPPPRVRSGREVDRAAADRLDEIRQYFKDQYAQRNVITRTTTRSGDELDWVPVEYPDEPPDIEAPEPPYDPDRPTRPQPFELAEPDAESGPPGTVPMLRKPLDRITPTGTLQDYLSKSGRAKRLTPPDDSGLLSPRAAAEPVHKYAHALQFVTNFGTEGFINTWRPYVQWSNEFSLGQLWETRGSGAGFDLQTVEVGSQVYYDKYGDWYPHLFIFFTTKNYKLYGDFIGGYNNEVRGWEQLSSTVYPGVRMAESVYGGAQYELAVKVMLYSGKWWIRVGNEWLGGYPTSLFNAAGLQDQAAIVDWGGEIIDDVAFHPEPTWTQMGSGHFPFEGWTRAAYMRNLAYQSDAAGTMTPFAGFTHVTNPNAYDISVDFSGATTWGSNFYWGGPGGVE
ncbi:neprosin family prolyl endopeptidase [Streptomyces sp. NPDC093111]|uniref:neprosin family prolyl endopeptidase n=1 Tax=Streptomyces sp. NPDC093111 TaxID=3154978 RepID=UPI00342397AE